MDLSKRHKEGKMQTTQDLYKKIAQLETEQDHLLTEVNYIDSLLCAMGFDHGLATVKAVAEDLLEKQSA